ncbi:MAG: glutathione peroxidase [Ferruginibacter sp.]
MTTSQIIKEKLYPIWMFFNRRTGKVHSNMSNKKPLQSFYELSFVLNNSNHFSFNQLKGKKVLIVNTASNCLFTKQYDELEKLYKQYNSKLVILGFPSNDFGEQEKADDNTIANFCKINFGVTFPLMLKSIVVKKEGQNEIYQWLTDTNKNGWNGKLLFGIFLNI